MPPGAGTGTGYTRSLGADLTNDHPISLNYTPARHPRRRAALGGRDPALARGERHRTRRARPGLQGRSCRSSRPGAAAQARSSAPPATILISARPTSPWATRSSCVQPLPGSAAGRGVLAGERHRVPRLPRQEPGERHLGVFGARQPAGGDADLHAAAAALREFPAGLPVWKAACLNCHDTHTVQGARRLLREGTDSLAVPKSGGASALEETCYACHTTAAQSAVTPATTVPDIRSDFQLARRMPIRTVDQASGTETHDIGGGFTDPGSSTAAARPTCAARISSSRARSSASATSPTAMPSAPTATTRTAW